MHEINLVVAGIDNEQANEIISLLYQAGYHVSNESRITDAAKPTSEHLIAENSQWYLWAKSRTSDSALKSEQRYQALAEAANDFVFVIDPEGIVRYVNSYGYRGLGLPVEKVIGHHLNELFPPDIAFRQIQGILKVVQTKQPIYLEAPNVIGVHELWLGTWLVPLKNEEGDRVEAVLGVSRDMTLQKEAQDELSKAFQREKELGEIRDNFIAMISHEFGTPLTVILSSAELLEHYGHLWSDEKRLEHFRRIQDSAKRINQMLHSILFIRRMSTQHSMVVPIEIDLLEFCKQVVEDVEMVFSNPQRILFHGAPECGKAIMDIALLRQVLENLLANALKYSSLDKKVLFEVRCEGSLVFLRICYEGVGIHPDELKNLFEPFFRGRNVAHLSGHGLGMAVVKKSIDSMRGEIQVDSRLGIGTTFLLTLPSDQRGWDDNQQTIPQSDPKKDEEV
jgi:PAS domain S-box-containing protein